MKWVIFSEASDSLIFFNNFIHNTDMAPTTKKTPAPPGVAIWVLVTLLWGTVFFWTSIFMLQLASFELQDGFFNPSGQEQWQVYGVQVGVLILFALVAMMVKNRLEPGGKKQIARWQNISEGKGEKIFVSFAGSIATSFFFTALTAATFLGSSAFFGFVVNLTLPIVLLAALFNIAAGIAASLMVGFVFLIAQVGRKKGKG